MDIKEIVASIFSVAIKVVIIIISAMYIYKYALVAYDYGYRIFSEKPMSSGEGRVVTVTVNSEMDIEDIGTLLENKGLIRDAILFRLQERLSENHGKIQPGTYDLKTSMTAEEMIVVMSASEDDSEDDSEAAVKKEMAKQGFDTDEDNIDDLEDFEAIEGFEIEGADGDVEE